MKMFSFLMARGGFYSLRILLFLTGFFLTGWLAGGCTDAGPEKEDEPPYLIRVAETEITAGEFERAFEMAMMAYPYNIVKQPQAFQEAREQVLQELVERAILAARARELGIRVEPAELADAVARIKKGYPEGAFEQALLESAVSYDAWKAALRRRLLMEKVVALEVESRIRVTDAEIRDYYRAHYAAKERKSAGTELHPDVRKALVRQLRAEKIETAYGTWLEKLKETYAIDINSAEWRRLAAESALETEQRPDKENANEKRQNG